MERDHSALLTSFPSFYVLTQFFYESHFFFFSWNASFLTEASTYCIYKSFFPPPFSCKVSMTGSTCLHLLFSTTTHSIQTPDTMQNGECLLSFSQSRADLCSNSRSQSLPEPLLYSNAIFSSLLQ